MRGTFACFECECRAFEYESRAVADAQCFKRGCECQHSCATSANASIHTAAVSESAGISLFLTVFAKNADDLCRI